MKKVLITLVVAALVVAAGIYLFIGDPMIAYNTRTLERTLVTQDDRKVTFNKMVEFEWDAMYYFNHKMSKEDIQGVIGFESRAIKDTSNDKYFQIVFVKDGKVVCNLNGVPGNLGYDLKFVDKEANYHKILPADDMEFEAENIEKVMTYTEIDKGIIVPPDKQMGIY